MSSSCSKATEIIVVIIVLTSYVYDASILADLYFFVRIGSSKRNFCRMSILTHRLYTNDVLWHPDCHPDKKITRWLGQITTASSLEVGRRRAAQINDENVRQ